MKPAPLILVLLFVAVLLSAFWSDPATQAATRTSESQGKYALLLSSGSISSGGKYRLHTTNPQVSFFSSGGTYILQPLASPSGSAAGCCCTYMPCMFTQ